MIIVTMDGEEAVGKEGSVVSYYDISWFIFLFFSF